MRFLAALLLLSLVAAGDTVYVKGGKKLTGVVVSEGEEVVVNEFNSRVAGMKLGVTRVPKSRVKKIVRTSPAPGLEFHERLAKAATPDDFLELAEWCAGNKLKEHRLVALERVLRLDPKHAAARKALGSKAPRGDWTRQYDRAARFLDADADRAALLAENAADAGSPFSEVYLQRALRSNSQPRGLQEDRPVALRADKLEANARYTLLVPTKYRPLEPTPLVVGLHGGGAGGADGKLVVGSGTSAMNFYRSECEQYGWLCVCPTALQAGWGGRANDDLIDAVLEEVALLYNVDENRIYLVGHSMGGGGTWRQGSRIPEVFAAIAPCAGFGVTGIDRLKKSGTPFYVYHSDDDPRCPVGGVRPQMMNLPGTRGVDFVYTELSGEGHGFPGKVRDDIFRFFNLRRRAAGRGRPKPQVRALSSFERKVTRDEKKYLPALEQPGEASKEVPLGALLKELRTGGGVAEQAVPKLIACADPATSGRVAKVLLKASSTPDVRRYAARVLGGRKAKEQVKALGRMLLIETESAALVEAVTALGAIDDPAAGDDLLRFLKKRHSYLEKRAQADEVHLSDWDTILPPMSKACALLGGFKTAGAAPVIVDTVLEGILLSPLQAVYDTAVGRPLRSAQALAATACNALARLGDPAALPALRKMETASKEGTAASIRIKYGPVQAMSRWPRDPRIAGYAREALQALEKR